jgi:acyl-CoA synthetase (NDP forming)
MGGGPFTQKISSYIEDQNLPVYHSIITWVTAAGALAKWSKVIERNNKQIDMISTNNLTTLSNHGKELMDQIGLFKGL